LNFAQYVQIACAALKALSALSLNDSIRQEFKRINGITHLMQSVSFLLASIKDVPVQALQESGNMMAALIRAHIHALSVQTANVQSKVGGAHGSRLRVCVRGDEEGGERGQ
jgi:hypothetical protein